MPGQIGGGCPKSGRSWDGQGGGSQAQGSILRQTFCSKNAGLISEKRQSVVYKLYPFQIEMRVKMQLTWSFLLSLVLVLAMLLWPRWQNCRFIASSVLILIILFCRVPLCTQTPVLQFVRT